MVEVNKVDEDGHTVVEAVEILMKGVTEFNMVMVMLLLVADATVWQRLLAVITQEITWPLVIDEEVKVALLVPTFTPFTFH